MKTSLINLVLALLFQAGAAHADSLHIRDMPLAGDYGGRYGHTVVIDGKICRLRNSLGFSAPQGCNYDLHVDADRVLHADTPNEGCSVDCEKATATNRDGAFSARRPPLPDTAPGDDMPSRR